MLVWLSKNVGYEKPLSVKGRYVLTGSKSEPKYARTDRICGTRKGIRAVIITTKTTKNNKRLN